MIGMNIYNQCSLHIELLNKRQLNDLHLKLRIFIDHCKLNLLLKCGIWMYVKLLLEIKILLILMVRIKLLYAHNTNGMGPVGTICGLWEPKI